MQEVEYSQLIMMQPVYNSNDFQVKEYGQLNYFFKRKVEAHGLQVHDIRNWIEASSRGGAVAKMPGEVGGKRGQRVEEKESQATRAATRADAARLKPPYTHTELRGFPGIKKVTAAEAESGCKHFAEEGACPWEGTCRHPHICELRTFVIVENMRDGVEYFCTEPNIEHIAFGNLRAKPNCSWTACRLEEWKRQVICLLTFLSFTIKVSMEQLGAIAFFINEVHERFGYSGLEIQQCYTAIMEVMKDCGAWTDQAGVCLVAVNNRITQIPNYVINVCFIKAQAMVQAHPTRSIYIVGSRFGFKPLELAKA